MRGNRDTIVLDIDGVVADLMKLLIKDLAEHRGLAVSYEEIHEYDCIELIGFDRHSDFLDYLVANDIPSRCDAVWDSVEAIQNIKSRGYQVHFLTARSFIDDALGVTHQWMVEKNIPYDHLEVVSTEEDKARYCEKIGDRLVAVVDDHVGNLDAIAERTNAPLFVFDQPWNRSFRHRPYRRINNLHGLNRALPASAIAVSADEPALEVSM